MSDSKPQGAADPSMDDILASIRKILNEDEPAAEAGAAAEEPIALTADMMISPPESMAGPAAVLPETPRAAEPAPSLPPFVPAEPEPAPLPPSADALIDPLAAAAAAASMTALAVAVSEQRTAPISHGGPSIEDVVREELRPMLKAWLDAHLPATVERLVRAEIERVMARQG